MGNARIHGSTCCGDSPLDTCEEILNCVAGKLILLSTRHNDDDPYFWSEFDGDWAIDYGGRDLINGNSITWTSTNCAVACGVGAQWIIGWGTVTDPTWARKAKEPLVGYDFGVLLGLGVKVVCEYFPAAGEEPAYAKLKWELYYQFAHCADPSFDCWDGFNFWCEHCELVATSDEVELPLPATPAELMAALNEAGLNFTQSAATDWFPTGTLNSGTNVVIFGDVCGLCESGIEADYTADNIDEDAGLDACVSPPEVVDLYKGCVYDVEVVTTPPEGVTVVDCYWSDGAKGCTRTIHLTDACGPLFDRWLSVTVLYSNGCKTTVAHVFSCCNCCTPEGSFTVAEEACLNTPCDGTFPACDFPFGDCSPNGWCHRYCYYTLTLNALTWTDCDEFTENEGKYLVEWDGMLDRNGDPLLDGCYDPGTVFHLRHDAGFEGACHCVRVKPIDSLGCEGEEEVFVFETGIPEVDGDCPTNCVPA